MTPAGAQGQRGEAPEVVRARLSRALAAGMRATLTVVSGIPGAGKTVLVRRWAADVDAAVAYLSLDTARGAQGRFWNAVLGAAASFPVSPAPRLTVRSAADGRRALVALLSRVEQPSVLILDHVENAAAPADVAAVCEAATALPDIAHLVVVTRARGRLPLGRLSLHRTVVEIGDAELRFDGDETVALFALWPEREPPAAAELRELRGRYDGWAAPLAAVAEEWASTGALHDAVEHVLDSDHGVVARTVDAALSTQEATLRSFMVEACILDRLAPTLCDAVTGRGDSAQLLHHLAAENLFVTAVDGSAGYRWQPLVRELMQRRLHARSRRRERKLHAAAVAWFESRGEMLEIARHHLAVGARAAAFAAASAHAEHCLDIGHFPMVALPADAFGSRWIAARASRMAGWATLLLAQGRHDDALPWLQRAAIAPARNDEEAATTALRIARGWCVYREMRGEAAETLEAAAELRRAASLAGHDHALRRAAVAMMRALTWQGATRRARDVHAAAVAITGGRRAGLALLAAALSQVACAEGRLHEAEDLAAAALGSPREAAGDEAAEPLDAWLTRGEVLLERNHLDAAADALQRAEELAERRGHDGFRLLAQARSAAVLHAGGLHDAALAALQAARARRDRAAAADPLRHQLDALEARLRLLDDDLAGAEALAAGLPQGPARTLLEARLALVRGRRLRARALLRSVAEDGPSLRQQIEVALLEGLVAAQADPRAADAALGRAVDLGRTEGFVRVFVDEGAALTPLLRRLSATDPSSYFRSLLGATEERRPALHRHRGAAAPSRLTERELAVLRWLPTPLSYQEIGARLYISLNTVKTHAKGIYRKLGAANRAEAVLRARAAGLLAAERLASGRSDQGT